VNAYLHMLCVVDCFRNSNCTLFMLILRDGWYGFVTTSLRKQISSITSHIASPLTNKSGENIMSCTLLRTSPSNAPAAQSESPWKAPKPLLPSVEDCLEQPPPQSPPLPHKLPYSSLLAQDHKQSQDTWQDSDRGQKRERGAMTEERVDQEEKNTSPPQNGGADSSKKKMRMVKEGERREMMFQQAFVLENSRRSFQQQKQR
jgi:hypothetical protein